MTTNATGNDEAVGIDDIQVSSVDINEEPTLTATGLNPTYTEDAAAVDLFSGVTASTVEAGQTFTSMTLTVTNVTDGANELLTFDGAQMTLTSHGVPTPGNGLNVNISLVGTTATVSFSGANLSAAQLQTLIDGLTYQNSSQQPTDADRVFTITQLVDSGSNTSPSDNTATLSISSTVNVDPVPETINGTPGDDVLGGTSGDDIIYGLGGGDDIAGMDGNDELHGGDGDDALAGGNGADQLFGDAGVDFLNGVAGNDTLHGGDDDDTLHGGNDDDALYGDGGNDYLRGGAGTNLIDGGAGNDRAAYFTAPNGVTVDLRILTAQNTGWGIDTLVGIENVSGTAFTDTLYGDDNDNWLWANSLGGPAHDQPTNDNLYGNGGNDLLEGNSGDHILDGGTGTDALYFGLPGEILRNTPNPMLGIPEGITINLFAQGGAQDTNQGMMTLISIENVSGSIYDDELLGDNNANVLAGDTGSDFLIGGGGNDTVYGDGAIRPDWGTPGLSGPITIFTVDQGTAVDFYDIDGDLVFTYTGGELYDADGNAYARVDHGDHSTFTVNMVDYDFYIDQPTTTDGAAGNDFIDGGTGDDSLYGGGGHDRLIGGANNDTLDGGDGDDYISGGTSTGGGSGNDIISGGLGVDRAGYFVFQGGVGVNVSLLLQGSAQNTGSQGMDTLTGIENVSGTSFADNLTGDGGNNWLWGSTANFLSGMTLFTSSTNNDVIDGGGGDDLITVGIGTHNLTGGSGNDTLRFTENGAITETGITASLATAGAQTTGNGSWTLTGFENLSGGQGGDHLTGDNNVNRLTGEGGDDTLDGRDGDDALYGDAAWDVDTHGTGYSGVAGLQVDPLVIGNDVLFGGYGNDLLDGGGGDDYLIAGFGNDTITGGAGFDVADYADGDAITGATVDLRIVGVGQVTSQGTDTLSGIEGLVGTQFADTLTGDGNANWLSSVQTLAPGNNDTLDGQGGDDQISIGIGNQTLIGGSGDDTLRFLNGISPTTAITLSLATQGSLEATGAGNWTYSGFENLSGGRAGDHLTGDGDANRLTGEGGDDVLAGGGGDDMLSGDASWNVGFHANGTAFGPAGFRFITGATGSDSLDGGAGDDTALFLVAAGAETLSYAYDGDDILVSRGAEDIARISFSGGTVTVTGLNSAADLGTDTLTHIEHLKFAIDGGDELVIDLGVTVDGYISGAFVFADADLSGTFDMGEASDTTDASGNFVLVGGSGPLIMSGGTDIATGLPNILEYRAPAGSSVVSPLTTLVQILMANNTLTEEQAEDVVAAALGLDPGVDLTTFDPFANPLDPNALPVAQASAIVAVLVELGAQVDAEDDDVVQGSVFGALADYLFNATPPVNLTDDAVVLDILDGGVVTGNPSDAAQAIAAAAADIGAATDFSEVAAAQYAALNEPALIGGDISDSVEEDGTVLASGQLTISDPDSPETFVTQTGAATTYGTFSVDDDGTWDYTLGNGSAAVQGLSEGEVVHDLITVTATDGTTQQIDITITGDNDGATIEGATTGTTTGSVTEDNMTNTASGTLTVADADDGEAEVVPIPMGTPGSGSYGSFQVLANGSWTYTLDNGVPAVNALGAGQTVHDTITVYSEDLTASRTLDITITGANDAPTIDGLSGDDAEWSPGDDPVAFDLLSNADVLDVDSTNFDGGRLTIDLNAGEVGGEDEIVLVENARVTFGLPVVGGVEVKVDGVVIGVYSGPGLLGQTSFVDFNASATADAVEQVLRAYAYDNVGVTPTAGVRDVDFYLTDGDGGQTIVHSTVTVSTAADPVDLYDENGAFVASFATIQDAIDAALDGYRIQAAAGTYTENLTVDKDVTINGDNAGILGTSGSRVPETIIDGQVTILAAGVTIAGVEIIGADTGTLGTTGVVVEGGADNFTLVNSILNGTGDLGMIVGLVTGLDVGNNLITGYSIGIYVSGGGTAGSIHHNLFQGDGPPHTGTGLVNGVNSETTQVGITDNVFDGIYGGSLNLFPSGPDSVNLNDYIAGNTISDSGADRPIQIVPTNLTHNVIGTNENEAFDGETAAAPVGMGGGGVTGPFSFDGRGGDDRAWGGEAGDTLTGGSGNDILYGEGGNDTLSGGTGNDSLNGAVGGTGDPGTDTATYAGPRGEYTIGTTTNAAGVVTGFTSVNDDVGAGLNEGTDTLTSIERLQFANVTLDLGQRVQLFDGTGNLVGTFDNIQDAINAASDGYRIEAQAGTYNESLTVDVDVTIEGANAGTAGAGARVLETLITGQVTISVAGVTINGVEITGAEADALGTTGVVVEGGANNFSLVNSILNGTGDLGMIVGLVTDLDVGSNLIEGYSIAMYVAGGGTTGAIHDNRFQGAGGPPTGLVIGVQSETTHVTIEDNIFDGIYGGSLFLFPSGPDSVNLNDYIIDNTISNSGADRPVQILPTNLTHNVIGTDFNEAFDGETAAAPVGMGGGGVTGSFSFDGRGGDDRAWGGEAGDTLTGGSGNDILYGEGGNDTLSGGTGNDSLNGAVGGTGDPGTDTATYAGPRGDYTIVTTTNAAGVVTGFTSVTDNVSAGGDEGADTLTSIERLQFADVTLDLGQRVQLFNGAILVGTFDNIQDAINAASDGYRIEAQAGTYNESLTVDVDVTIEGANAGSVGADSGRGAETIITGQVTIASDGVTINGVEITGAELDALGTTGVVVEGGSDNFSLVNSILNGTGDLGMIVGLVTGLDVGGNLIEGYSTGMYVAGGGTTGSVHDNRFQGAGGPATGLINGLQSETTHVTIEDNTFAGIFGGSIFLFPSGPDSVNLNDYITGNTIFGSGADRPIQIVPTNLTHNVIGTDENEAFDGETAAAPVGMGGGGVTGAFSFDGRGGDDRAWGGGENDSFTGGTGNDWLFGNAGDDNVFFSGNRSDYTVISLGAGIIQVTDNRPGSPDGIDRLEGVERVVFANNDYWVEPDGSLTVINDAPLGVDHTLTVTEDAVHIFSVADFSFTDTEGNQLLEVTIVDLPTNGTIYYDAMAISAGATISAADIMAGRLTYLADLNDNGAAYATFTYQVRDNGGTAHGGFDTDPAPNTITVNVTAVNDAPTVTFSAPPAGSETRVNSFVGNPQQDAAVAALAGGGHVVVWASIQDGSGYGVHAQRYDASGAPLGSETPVNTTTIANQFEPDVAALADGSYVVVWSGNGPGDPVGVFMQRYNAAGVAQGGETLVNGVNAFHQSTPSVTALAGGGYVVVWQSEGQDGSGAGIFGQRFNTSGVPQGGEFPINTVAGGVQQYPSVTGLAGGGFAVTWFSDHEGSGQGVYVRRFDALGVGQGNEVRANTFTANDQSYSSIGALQDGGYVVAWESLNQDGTNYSVYAQRYSATGAPVGVEFRVNTTLPNQQEVPTVAGLADGGFVITWRSFGQDGDDYGVYSQRYNAAGATVGVETLINTTTSGTQLNPDVAALPGSGYVIAWQGNGVGDGSGVFSQLQSTAFVATEQVALSLKGRITVSDVDAGSAVVTATLSVGYGVLNVSVGGSGASIVSGNGTGTVVLTGTIAQLNALLNSDATSTIAFTADTDEPPASTPLTVTVNDGGATGADPGLTGGVADEQGSATATINIISVNDEPTLAATAANPIYIEDTAASDLFSGVTVSTVETGQSITALTLTVTNVTDGAAEILRFDGSDVALTNGNSVTSATNGLSVNVSLTGSTATVSFSGATLTGAQVATLIDALTYRNTSQAPTDANRVVTITQLVDSGLASAPDDNSAAPNLSSTVDVEPVNDAPTSTLIANDTRTYIEGSAPVTLDVLTNGTIADVDSPNFAGGSLTLTLSDPLDEDNLLIINTAIVTTSGANILVNGTTIGTFSGGDHGDPLAISFNTNATPAAIQLFVRAIGYSNAAGDIPNGGLRIISWLFNDGDGTAHGGVPTLSFTSRVNVLPVNDAPDSGDFTVMIDEDETYHFDGALFPFSDPENNPPGSLRIESLPGHGTLYFDPDGGGPTAAFAASPGLSISWASLPNLFYVPDADYFGPDSFTFAVVDNGGAADATPNTLSFDIGPVNDPAIITGDASGEVTEAGGVANGTPGDSSDTGDLDAADVDNTTDGWQAVLAGTASDFGYGTYSLSAAGVWVYTLDDTDTAVQALNGTDTLTDSFDALTEDGTLQTVTITIHAQNDAAAITGDASGEVTEAGGVANGTAGDATDSGDLNFTDVDNTADAWQAVLAATAGDFGYGTYTLGADGVWTYTLDDTDTAVQALNGTDTLTDSFTAVTGDGTTQVVTITIHAQNDTPIIIGDASGDVTEAGGVANGTAGDASDTGDLDATDVDNGNDAWQVVAAGTASAGGYGTYALSAAGVWVYTLDDTDTAVQALNGTDTLTDTFDALTEDGTHRTVTITIHAQNDAAAITGDASGDVTEAGGVNNGTAGDASDSGDLDAADVDDDDDAWQVVSAGTASAGGYGTYALSAVGVWVYTLDDTDTAVQALNGTDTLTDTFDAITEDGTHQTVTITIHAQDDAGIAKDDEVITDEASVVTGNLFDDNGNGEDVDVDNMLTISAVNGLAGNVGVQITLDSGALLRVNADGSFSYDPNHAFDETPTPGSGASNQPAPDGFTYTLASGNTATVSISINGLDTDDVLTGTGGADILGAGIGADFLDGLGGGDTMVGGAGNDIIFGGDGNDSMFGEGDDDYINGGIGADFADGGLGNDAIEGTAGNDNLYGNDGNDNLLGGADDDYLNGGIGNDFIDGGTGNDAAEGLAGDDILFGGDGNDNLLGGDDNDYMSGGIGADFADGGNGNDAVDGGAGNDNMYGGAGNDNLIGGADDDYLNAGAGTDYIEGGLGKDVAEGGDDFDILFGLEGDDILLGNAGDDYVYGGEANDILLGGDGLDYVNGGAGADYAEGGIGNDAIEGEAGNDIIYGNDGADNLIGGDNDDYLNGGAGGDFIDGGTGNDAAEGGAGNDIMFGGDGNDNLLGGDNDDSISGGIGADFIDAGTGNDAAQGGAGNDIMFGGDGNDNLLGNDNDDYLSGGIGADYLEGGAGADTAEGGAGADILIGGDAADNLLGGDGDDYAQGDAGDDTLAGNLGFDTLVGGAGADRFVFNTALGATNIDTVTDFAAGTDKILLDNAVFAGLSEGELDPSAFVIGTGAAGDGDRIIYDSATGALYFDSDGGGGNPQIRFATLAAGLDLHASDFIVF